MYAGYINVDQQNGRNLFYWFVEAFTSPETKPLVLWLNGGPGCSSIGGGLMSELGPFYPDITGTNLLPNPYSWNNVANIIYLESPAGVGYSFSETTSDYTVGDNRTAADIYTFLQEFLVRYPQYANSPFHITGESYGGHYVTVTSAYIVMMNKRGGNPQINFAGFAVGNAWTVAGLDNTGAVEFWWGHALVSNASRNGILNTCNMSDIGPIALTSKSPSLREGSGRLGFVSLLNADGSEVTYSYKNSAAQSCDDWQNQAFNEMGNIDIYDAYVDVCAQASTSSTTEVQPSGTLTDSNNNAGCSTSYDPCIDNAVQVYMNRPDVQAAIHANASIKWTDCSSIINYSRFDLLSSVIPAYQYLISEWPQGNYWVYSGDVDAIVPVTGTRLWLDVLNLTETEAFRSYTVNGQVGGYTVGYAGLRFATVRNAGHMVPYTQQQRSLYMITQYLNNQPL